MSETSWIIIAVAVVAILLAVVLLRRKAGEHASPAAPIAERAPAPAAAVPASARAAAADVVAAPEPAVAPAAVPAPEPTQPSTPAPSPVPEKTASAAQAPAPSVEPVAVDPVIVEPLTVAPVPVEPLVVEPTAAAEPLDIEPTPVEISTPPAPSPAVSLASEGGDNLLRLKGVGPKIATLLTAQGITRYAQIAAWTETDLTTIDAKLGSFAGRPKRDNWIDQARFLAAGDVAGYEAKYGKL